MEVMIYPIAIVGLEIITNKLFYLKNKIDVMKNANILI